ncbi:GNAT family N-acetyltransferase [Halpernia frigidisoli]|uniref:Acetyltransferase (GNAT) domain-containing protein n=1 Tax=Halpernia frigidisoli TaxID=1125876 RepID=A0A1I3FNN3_9FLAO|nr:GNAT family N-acetyltransferase [Halpernia frigidisoli]SFI12790.1 Acetyltransferase (GNAT) domain-containing protein [Halpernia frigidisoli]
MIELKTFNKTELESLIKSDDFKNFPFKPITIHRAVSHINNPRAKEDQTLLILAFSENKLAGYIGILPDEIYKNQQLFACGWLSTLWIDPNFRGKKIAQQLLSKACDEYSGHILITEFTPEAENMYKKSGYFDYQDSLKGRSYHLLSNLKNILPHKNKKWQTVYPLLNIFDFSVNSIIKAANNFKENNRLNFKTESHLNKESEDFIKLNSEKNSFNTDLREINWITNYPWILSSKQKDENYHFSDYCENFEYVLLKIYNSGKLESIFIISIRDKNAKLHFVFGKQNGTSSKILLHYLRKNNVSNFISFEKTLNEFLDKNIFFYKKERNRKFLMHKTLKSELGQDFKFQISAGDSDAVFT